MKFLLFNIAVAAALVFLFTADRGEVQKIAGQVHDAAGDMKSYAGKALVAGKRMIESKPATPDRKTETAPAAAPPLPPATSPAANPGLTAPKPVAEPPAPPVRPKLSRRLAENLPVVPATGPETRAAPTAKLDPEIARRRREVLNGIDTADLAGMPAAAPALKEGTQLMTPSERRKELLSLAEEMELLYARSLGQ